MIEEVRAREAQLRRIEELEAENERLKGALMASGVTPRLVDRIAAGDAGNWPAAVNSPPVQL